MPFTVPNAADAVTYPQQARLDSRDLDMLSAAYAVTAVISGCAVTAQGSPNMTVAVAAGVVRIAGRKVVYAGGNSGTFGAADATNPRIDLLTMDTAGALQIVAGTAGATPVIPVIPESRVVLARVDVFATATTITTGQIVDKRVMFDNPTIENIKWYGAKGNGRTVTDGAMTTGTATLTSATAAFTAADVGKNVQVSRASSTAVELYTSIVSVTNGTTVVVAMAPAFSLTARTLVINGTRTVADGVTTADSTTVTSATAAFTAADVGKQIRINAAHSVSLATTISGFTNATTVTLAASATRTTAAAQVVYGSNDTQPLIDALAACAGAPTTCYIPEGLYLVEIRTGASACALIYSNTRLSGDGWGSTLRDIGGQPPDGSARALLGINSWDRGSSDTTQNVFNVAIENLHFQGTTVEDGFHQWTHLIELNAASDVVFRACKFSNWRGDACYIGSGTSVNTLERHNQRIRWENCLWDGANRDNRQCISFIDVDDATVNRCTFLNSGRANMPGAIDIEPSGPNTFSVIRSIRIDNCLFSGTGGNAGIIGMNVSQAQAFLTTPMRGYNITNCVFTNPVGSTLGFLIQQGQSPTDSTPRNDIYIAGNWFYDIDSCEVEGCRGVEIDDNFFINTRSEIYLGYSSKCVDISIINNVFKGCGQVSSYVISPIQALRVNVDRNYFENCGLPGGGSGDIVRFANGGGLAVPTGVTVVPQGATGATTRGYRVAAIRDQVNFKSTLAAATVQITNSNATLTGSNFNRISWTADYQPGGFRIYGRTSGSELLMATVGPGVFTWDDTGAVTPSGALPGSDTTAQGNTDGISFTNNVVRQGQSVTTVNIASVAANHTTVQNDNTYVNNQQPGLGLSAAFINATTSYTVTTAALTVDASLVPPNGTVTLTGSTASAAGALTISNPTKGQIITFEYVIPTINFTYSTAANMKFAAGAAATHSLTAGYRDIYTMRYDGTNWNEITRAIAVR